MGNETVEEKVKVTNTLDLLNIPDNSWVEINDRKEFKIRNDNLMAAKTIYLEGNYVCKNAYGTFLASMTPFYVEKFLRGTGGAANYLRILRDKGGLEL
jgi:hypothetical protein